MDTEPAPLVKSGLSQSNWIETPDMTLLSGCSVLDFASVGPAARASRILADYGSVVVHIFYEPVREFYALERLWADAPRLTDLKGQDAAAQPRA